MHECVLVVGDDPEDRLMLLADGGARMATEEEFRFLDREEMVNRAYLTGTTNTEFGPYGGFGYTDPEKPVIPNREVYLSVEEFALKRLCGTTRDEKTGKFGFWYNPHGVFDWVETGGRCKEMLLHSDGSRVDQARKGEIDWARIKPGLTPEKKAECITYFLENPEEMQEGNLTLADFLDLQTLFRSRSVLDADNRFFRMDDTQRLQWAREYFQRFIAPLPEDALLTIVDGHS